MAVQPCVNVRKVGIMCAMVVSFNRRTGPTTNCANAMSGICHQNRKGFMVPNSAARHPMRVAGTAAVAHTPREPYTSMRLLAAARVSSAAIRRLADRRLAG